MLTFLIIMVLTGVAVYSPGPCGYFLRIFGFIALVLIVFAFAVCSPA